MTDYMERSSICDERGSGRTRTTDADADDGVAHVVIFHSGIYRQNFDYLRSIEAQIAAQSTCLVGLNQFDV